MGTICALSYVNLFMTHFERKLLYLYLNIFIYIPQIYRQYIFYIDRQQNTSTEVSKTVKYIAPIN